MKIIILILFVFTLCVYTQSAMITENSRLENAASEKIEYKKFVEMMGSGKYIPKPILDNEGKTIGYRLIPKAESSKETKNNILSEIPIGKTVSLEVVYHKHILLPVKFNTQNGAEEAWLIFDTGTFVPVFLTPTFQKNMGPVQSLEIGDIVIKNPAFGSYQFPQVIENYNRLYSKEASEKLNGKPIVGVIGFPMFVDYLISIDLKNQNLLFRNNRSNPQTLFRSKPFAEIKYRSDLNNIWFPVKINNREGFAHLDTGYPQTWVEKTQISGNVKSFSINDVEFIKNIEQIDFNFLEQKENYSSLEFNLISNVGNNFLESFVLTIDTRERKLFFELNKKVSDLLQN